LQIKSTNVMRRNIRNKSIYFPWAYTRKNSAIDSGATPIGSAGRAPDDIYPCILEQRRRKRIQEASLLPSGGKFLSVLVK
jgi:hypothetical protein